MQVSDIYHRMKSVLELASEFEQIKIMTVWRQGPSVEQLERFAIRYDVSLEWLATGRGSQKRLTPEQQAKLKEVKS
jgi:hypothetical protein